MLAAYDRRRAGKIAWDVPRRRSISQGSKARPVASRQNNAPSFTVRYRLTGRMTSGVSITPSCVPPNPESPMTGSGWPCPVHSRPLVVHLP